jgi:GR25 family glycosyltransferase involved in LPS biosynthesis
MTGIQGRYINLDTATDRRETLERSYAAANFSDRWTMTRFSAISAESERVRNLPGRQSDPYKGNFLSHLDCIAQSLDNDDHLFICEDDCSFSPETGPLIEKIIDQLDEASWDVLHTEITLISAVHYSLMFKLGRMNSEEKIRLINLNSFPHDYTGSSAYLVNRKSKDKFLGAFKYVRDVIDNPFDICLRGSILYNILNAYVAFPFLTFPSLHADQTQAPADTISTENPALQLMRTIHLELSNASRRLFSIGFDPAAVMPPHLPVWKEEYLFDEKEKAFATIMPWMLAVQDKIHHQDFTQLSFADFEIPRDTRHTPGTRRNR